MRKLLDLLAKQKMSLLVELPEINLELLETAISAGADAVQLKCDVDQLSDLTNSNNGWQKALVKNKIPIGLAVSKKHHLTEKQLAHTGNTYEPNVPSM